MPFVLGLNGNAITMHPDLADRVCPAGGLGDPQAIGEALRTVVAEEAKHDRVLRFGVVHRYSSHNYMLRYWLAASGIRPDEDVEIATVSPPFVAEAMAAGEIDGACVGEPWNSAAVARGVGVIVLATAQIWRRGVEKVLAFRAPVLEARRPAAEALVRAFVSWDGEVRQAASNALMVVDEPSTPTLIETAKKSASPEQQPPLDALAHRFANNPAR